MSDEGRNFLVEEFLEAITAQLDRAQDALSLKAVNRPLTYAIKEFSLDLKVFVDMDQKGNIRMRPSGPNETGASTVEIGFTTITRAMIEENTVSLASTRSPTLDEVGLDQPERRRLERLGVRNIEELERLRSSTGSGAVSRLSGLSADRLRAALRVGRPHISGVTHEPSPSDPIESPEPPAPPEPPNGRGRPPVLRPVISTRPDPGGISKRPIKPTEPDEPGGEVRRPVKLRPGERLRLRGRNLLGSSGPPQIRLNQQSISPVAVDDDHVVVEVPRDAVSGALSIELPDGEVVEFAVEVERAGPSITDVTVEPDGDQWSPGKGG